MINIENTVKSETVYKGNIISVRLDTVALPDGGTAARDVVEHGGGVCVLPFDSEGNVYLVRQYRKGADEVLLEAPAGKLSAGEGHFTCGARELLEETGFYAREYVYLGFIYPTPAYVTEKIHIYHAYGLSRGEAKLDFDEFLDVCKLPYKQARAMARSGEITDAKTVVSLLRGE